MTMKTCGRCSAELPASDEHFARHRGSTDGLQGVCKPCRKAARDARSPEQKEAERERLRRVYEGRKNIQQERREVRRKANLAGFAQQTRLWRDRQGEAYKEAARLRARDWYTANRDRARTAAKDRNQKLRAEMIAAYGGKCACCGETNFGFLTLDHIEGGGREHRETVNSGGTGIARNLKERGWPKGEFQILCYHCNCGRAHHGGVCPHHLVKAGVSCEAVVSED